ncbi:MAG: GEVED domain-containing protein, partial [bacterium]|nr:GEVED domain-containing protein [bacterium]
MKPTLTQLAIIALFTTTLFALNPGMFPANYWNESHQDTPAVHQENEELSMPNTLILDIGIMVSDVTPETGVAFSYTISYATQSLVEDADNPVIEVPLPNGIQVVSFVGNAEVGSTETVNVMGTPTFRINMKNPLEAGAAGILMLELVIPPGQVCDGTVIPAAVTFSADDADNSPVSDQTDITVSAPNEAWNVNVSAVAVGVPGSTSLFQVGISPSAATGFIALDNATLTAEIPANTNVVNCSGCMQSGTTLTWDVSNTSGPTSFPLVLEFPSPPFDFSDNFSVEAVLDGTTISDCPVSVDDTDTFNGTLPSPNPLIQCGVGLSTYEIGDEGVFAASADVTGNVEVDNFTAVIRIPAELQINSILPSTYVYDGFPVTVTYETNLSGPAMLGSFNTTLDGSSGGFAAPVLGAGEFLTALIFEFGTVPPGFGPLNGIELDYEVLAVDQLGNTVIGANPRITDPTYVSCPNMVYTCISPEVEVSADYEGEPVPNDLCDESTAVTRIPPVGPGAPNKSASGNVFFVGDEVTYTLSFHVCGPDPLVNGLVTDDLPNGVALVPGSVAYSTNITAIGTPALNQTGNTLTWDFSGIDLPGSTEVDEDCGETYIIEYTVEVTEVANGPGNVTLNNAFTIDGDDVDIAPEAALPGDEESITVPPIGPTNLSKTSLNGSAGNPEDTITFRLRFRNQGPFAVNNVVIADQLPMGLDFVPGTIEYNGGLTPADNDGMVYNSGNRTLTFEWASLSGSAPGERYSEFYEITYDAAIPRGFPPGPLQNCFTVTGTGDYIRQDLPLGDCETFTVNALVQTSSQKGVRGDCDADFVFFDPNGPNPTLENLNGIGRTFQGGAADWKLIIENTGNVEVKDITVIDIMPFIGDEAISFPADRESEWRTNFVEVVSMPANATVEYSIEPNPCRADFSPAYEPAGCTGPFWSTTPPVDVTETQALKFFLPTPLGPGEQTEIIFSTQAPVDAPEDAIAWNSLAYQGRRTDTPGEEYFLAAEPNKVGIAIKADTVSVGNYVWSDDNMDGIQNEPAELGINGVSVDLYRLVGMKDATPGAGDDVFVGNRLTGDNHFGNPGYYLFANLPEGQYYAVFDENSFPPGQVPPADMPTLLNAGGDDVVDSDADQTTMFMTDLTPALTEAGQAKDTTLDLGLIATDCGLFPTVLVMCDDRGTAQVNDDRYTWTLQVNREINSALDNNGTFTLQVMNADGLEIDVVPNLAYGAEHPIGDEFGPLPISGGDLMFEVKDDIDLSCEAFGTVEAPATLNVTNLSATDCVDDGMGNLSYNLTGTVEIGGAPTGTGTRLEVFFMDSGNTESQIFDPIAEDGTYNFSFNGLACDGESFDVEARFIDGMGNMIDGTCTGERRLHEPCYLAITDIQVEDNCRADGTYTVNVIGTYFNGTGDMEISIDGNSAFDPATQTLDLANRADGVEETLASFTKTCDGQLHEVTAAFNGSCMDMANFEGPRDRDFGDVPDTYGTTLGQNGAFHIIHDDLFLGDCVDSELDGSPEAQAGVDGTPSAGAGTGGDDGNGVETEMGEASFSACPGDDEDGVRFITSMVPGNEACVEVTTTNNTGSLAALQMWVDFDGNGSFSNGEEVTFSEPIVGTGTNTTDYCFDVPASATFPNLETFVRVRLSSAGGLNATGPANDGEVEDYYLAFAKIGDFVWEDLNYDGIQDNGEPGIAGAEVSISGIDLNSDPFTASTTTTGSGMYMFPGLFPGDYMLTFTTPDELVPSPQGEGNDGMVDSDADPGTGNTITYTLSAGDNNPDVDAGFFVPAIEVMAEEICVDNAPYVNYSITPIGFTPSNGATITWVDPDADTVVAVLTNQALSGTLLWPGAVVDNGVAVDWPGWVLVDGVWERVEDGLRPELRLRFDVNPSDSTIVLYPPATPQCSTNPPLGELGDYVWEDINGNGVQEAGEPPVENVTVNLLTENGDFIESTMTDENGLYLFDSLGPASFIVEFITPNGYEITPANNAGMDDALDSDAGGDGQTEVVTLGSGETNYTIDAGIYQPASLGSTVWEDTNGNGQQDNDEDGVPGVTVTLFTCVNGMPDAPVPGAEVMTDGNGDYEFTGLAPGSYTVVFDYSGINGASDYIFTLPNIENNTIDALDSDVFDENGNVACVTLESGEDNLTIDAGIYPDEDGDLVPDDIDPSEEADPTGYIYCESTGEIISGGSISVSGPGPVDVVQDGSTGFYGFFAASVSGTYTIQFTPPAGYVVSPVCMEEGGVFDAPIGITTLGSGEAVGNPGFLENPDCGSNPFYYSIDLEPGVFVFNNNIPLSCASIGDLVWEDDNLDGVQDNEEAGVPDVQVVLFECNNDVKGAPVDTTLTDNNGNYIFTGLPAGVEYCVLFDLEHSPNADAAAYQFTTQDQTDNGGNDTNDSDPDTNDGCTPGVILSEGEAYEDFDAGLLRLDFGDLEEFNNIATTAANNGAAHSVPTNVLLKLGSTVDAEANGQPSADAFGDGIDEDGVILPLFITGNPVDVPVTLMNMTGGEAKLVFFIDWNDDGDFEELGEVYDLMVPNNATEVIFEDVTPPLTAVTGEQQVSVRFRLSTDMDAVMSPTGIAPDGEVEDYLTPIRGLDYGDLNDTALGTGGDPNDPLTPANYATFREDNGPRHRLVTDMNENALLKIGTALDDEANGQPSVDAGATVGGDDNTSTPASDPDDEDGLDLNNLPRFILTQTTTLDIPVMNMTGSEATLALFLDFNKDGAFDPAAERFSMTVPVNATTVSIEVDVPVTSVVGQDLGLRLRLANDPADVATALGEAQSGEVEDYMVQIVGFDYGDLPVSYGTQDPDAPKHIISEDLLLGQCVDVELDGQPETLAEGDDNGSGLVTFGTCNEADDDENGIDFITPLLPGTEACVSVTAVNNTGEDAVLQFWIDWNGDGAFGPEDEVTFTTGHTVPGGGLSGEVLCFEVPEDATFEGGSAYARARLSPEGGLEPGSQTGDIPFGEIEDYQETLYLVGSYVWEDLDGDGLQGDFSTPCFNGLAMELEWAGVDGNLNTANDNEVYTLNTASVSGINGQYVFEGLIPGTYTLRIAELPTGYGPTSIGAGNDEDLDSNDPANTSFTILEDGTLRTGEDGTGDAPGNINGYPDDQDNLSFDFGFRTEGYEVICNCDGSITLDWAPFSTGNNWTVDVEDENGNPVVDFVNMSSTQVTFVPGTLMNGACYNFAITENLGNAEVEAISGLLHANCNPVPVLTLTGEGPTCPTATDGALTITLEEQGCNATYDVYLIEAGVGETLVGSAVALSQPILVEGLGEGTFRVRLELVARGSCAYGDGCLPELYQEEVTLETTDSTPPSKTVTDQAGLEPPMTIVYESIPEGECGVQFNWFVELDDDCLSDGVSLEAQITSQTDNPSVSPGASVTVLDEEPLYVVAVHAGIGNNTLLLITSDEAGNRDTMTYEITVVDNRPPEIYGPGDMQVQIPACEDSAPVNWQVSAIDDCDLDVELEQTSG